MDISFFNAMFVYVLSSFLYVNRMLEFLNWQMLFSIFLCSLGFLPLNWSGLSLLYAWHCFLVHLGFVGNWQDLWMYDNLDLMVTVLPSQKLTTISKINANISTLKVHDWFQDSSFLSYLFIYCISDVSFFYTMLRNLWLDSFCFPRMGRGIQLLNLLLIWTMQSWKLM